MQKSSLFVTPLRIHPNVAFPGASIDASPPGNLRMRVKRRGVPLSIDARSTVAGGVGL